MNLIPIEVGKQLSLLDLIAVIDVELLHDAAGLGLNLDLGDRRDLAGCHHAFCQVSPFNLGELRGVDLVIAGRSDHHTGNDQSQNNYRYRAPDNDSLAPLLPAIAVTFHDRLLPEFES